MPFVNKYAEMEEDFNMHAMMEIPEMEMDATKIAKFNKDGLVWAEHQ